MSKKGWLSGRDDDDKAQQDAAQRDAAAESRSATDDKQAGEDVQIPHRNIIDDARNVETDDGSVNPHNEAMAQKPVAVPKDRTDPKPVAGSTDDLKAQFREWGKRLRLGGPNSADWERFEQLTGDRQAPPEPPVSSVPEGAQPAAPDAQSSTDPDHRSADATRAKSTRG